ncbi:Imm21 family immunity protein [Streptomyces sp. NPDC054840]
MESGCGPLVVVPAEVLTHWEGVDGEGPESDHGRACAAVGPTGLRRALVDGVPSGARGLRAMGGGLRAVP